MYVVRTLKHLTVPDAGTHLIPAQVLINDQTGFRRSGPWSKQRYFCLCGASPNKGVRTQKHDTPVDDPCWTCPCSWACAGAKCEGDAVNWGAAMACKFFRQFVQPTKAGKRNTRNANQMPSREVYLRVFGQFLLLFGIFYGTEGLVYTSCKIPPVTCNFFAGFILFLGFGRGFFICFLWRIAGVFDVISSPIRIDSPGFLVSIRFVLLLSLNWKPPDRSQGLNLLKYPYSEGANLIASLLHWARVS